MIEILSGTKLNKNERGLIYPISSIRPLESEKKSPKPMYKKESSVELKNYPIFFFLSQIMSHLDMHV